MWCYISVTKWGSTNEEKFIGKMNELGRFGWELVSVVIDDEENNVKTAYFKKRPN